MKRFLSLFYQTFYVSLTSASTKGKYKPMKQKERNQNTPGSGGSGENILFIITLTTRGLLFTLNCTDTGNSHLCLRRHGNTR